MRNITELFEQYVEKFSNFTLYRQGNNAKVGCLETRSDTGFFIYS